MCSVVRYFCVALSLWAVCASASAVTLDWDAVTWTPNALSQSFDIDPTRAGTDVTMTISGDTGRLYYSSGAPNPMTPAVTSVFEGGLGSATKSLEIALDLTSRTQAVIVTVDFSALYAQGVENVSFSLFDVDFQYDKNNSEFQDQLRSITALSIDGVTRIAADITTSGSNGASGSGVDKIITGSGTALDVGATSGSGNVLISFGTNAIKSFSFTYGSGTGTAADPTYQHIGIHDINFTPVPEINPAWSAVFSCVAAAGLILRHRANFRK